MNDMSVADLCRNVYRPIKGTFRIFKPTPKTPVEQSVTEMIHEAKKQNCLEKHVDNHDSQHNRLAWRLVRCCVPDP